MNQKWNLQDIRPVEPRTKRRVAPSNIDRNTDIVQPTKLRRPVTEREATLDLDQDLPETIPVIDGNKRRKGGLLLSIILFFVIIAGGIGFSIATGGAVITIYPKSREITVNAEFTAYKQNTPGELSYEIMTIEAAGERQVTATGQETVTEQATGEIEISKATPGAEKLIKNTRFETPDGKIFRIQESVVVPGAVKNAAGTLVPGTIRAQVFADVAGTEHNIAANTKMTVPGFKESNFTELYNAISAQNPEAFTNGMNGPRYIIDENELATAKQSLQMELRDSLLARIEKERPAGFTTFKDATAITYTTLPAVQYGDSLVTIREQAVLQIPLFKEADFASFIAKESIVGYDPAQGVRINNIDSLTFSYPIATTSQSNLANMDSLLFKIAGAPKIVWTFDGDQMKADLLGMQKTAFISVLGKYPGVDRGEVKIRPFWKRSFPKELSEIEITEVLSTSNDR